ncbi:VIT1/CCC1 transporter family protein [Mobiluncus curtisii]|uniref:Membrane protein n=2 Tax=Mobiluncus curtisii TaxID=2051 RepID=D6ZJN7_MOBCV|nr:VIT1/CCC1 family protein [Mobiluncus curtisii]ADI66936.1 membrane protein [Mobiluncus curtisii ATCC 43063]NMW45295.1 rubrerythrin family protein [Mobiluncus curtisii]NMW88091.1 rubrerythrin family protein [Mobiluncus curtisii]QQU09257.1 VIT1/CCC1 transporter family protein [Mobiluncus curtisii]SQB63309.1 VIT family [Mobiluncus curtisii]
MNAHSLPDPTPEQIKRWRRYLAEERDEAKIYRAIAKKRYGMNREILLELADAEKRHENYWLAHLGPYAEPAPHSPWYIRLLQELAIKIGSIFVLAMMQRSEERGTYDVDADATPQMAADEHLHSEVVRALAARSRARFSGRARAMVFGINDGLVSNLALVAGIAGTGVPVSIVLVTGLTGLVAGALSMGAGEFISITSQRELLESSLPNPDVKQRLPMLDRAANELKLLFMARGENPEDAAIHAVLALETIDAQLQSRTQAKAVSPDHPEDLGQGGESPDQKTSAGNDTTTPCASKTSTDSPTEIADNAFALAFDNAPTSELEAIGSGSQAAVSSFLAFTLGAFVPLIPFLLGFSGIPAICAAVILVGLILLMIGGTIGILSGKPPFLRALRQAAIGIGAAVVTYLLGLAAGGALSL